MRETEKKIQEGTKIIKDAIEALEKAKAKCNKKKSKKYTNMMASYKKQLVKNANETRPWDYGWMLDAIILNIKFMKDYYHLGENVMAMEDTKAFDDMKDWPTREKMCDEILEAYDNWQNVEDKYLIHHDTGGKENGKGLVSYTLLEDGTEKQNPITDWWIEYKLGSAKETYKVIAKEKAASKKLFFKLLEKYIDKLWD